MAREKKLHEQMLARFPKDTFGRIDAVLELEETRADLVRIAVERELARRERQAKKPRAD